MSELVDHLANLTGFRDRDVVDVTLVGAFRDLLQPLSVAVYRCVDDGSNDRWLTRARLGRSDVAASADSAWVDLEQLPRVDAYPLRLECLRTQDMVSQADANTHITAFPLATDREVVGVLEVETQQPLAPDQERLVRSILRIYRNFQGLLDYSERDTLTGLLNRKTFDETFLKISARVQAAKPTDAGRRSAASEQRHWLGVVDIDHFKHVNDTYGHLIGDEVLLLLSRLMRSSFRFHDLLYRFGGEEFVVLMRCATDEDARMALERMRGNTKAYPFPQVGGITISIGFTEVKPGDTPSAAFERADRAVYFGKAHGRDQVQSHADLVAKGLLEDGSKIGDVELF
jgi:diguanylate cyclase (GGDEF)-like protein